MISQPAGLSEFSRIISPPWHLYKTCASRGHRIAGMICTMRPFFSQGGAKIWGPPAPHMTCCPGSRPATSFLLQRDFIEPSPTLLLHKIGIVKWVKIAQSCPTLCNPMYYMVHEILQARILEWVAFPFFRESSQCRDRTQVTCIAGRFFTSWAIREAQEYWSG